MLKHSRRAAGCIIAHASLFASLFMNRKQVGSQWDACCFVLNKRKHYFCEVFLRFYNYYKVFRASILVHPYKVRNFTFLALLNPVRFSLSFLCRSVSEGARIRFSFSVSFASVPKCLVTAGLRELKEGFWGRCLRLRDRIFLINFGG